MKPLILAIDFGTTNSLVAAAQGDTIHAPIPLDPLAPDPTLLRSLLYFPSMAKVYYGTEAMRRFEEGQGEGRLIRSIKKQLPSRTFIGTWIGDRPVNLEDLVGFFLAELRRRANLHFKSDVNEVVLGRPARFAQEDADDRFAQFRLEEAAKRAGFTKIEFCPEPIAAAHEFRTGLKEEKIVLVGDFGGGTSDFTVMRMSKREYQPSDVLSLGGVSVAGDAFDGAIMRHDLAPYFGSALEYKVPFGTNILRMPIHLMEKICSPGDISFLGKRDILEFFRTIKRWVTSKEDEVRLDRLLRLVEEQLGFYVFEQIEGAKRVLSENDRADVALTHPGIEVTKEIWRQGFESAAKAQVNAIVSCLDETLAQANLKAEAVDVVCCTGGTAKVPALNQELVKRFGKEKIQEHKRFHSVVEGLARRAGQL